MNEKANSTLDKPIKELKIKLWRFEEWRIQWMELWRNS